MLVDFISCFCPKGAVNICGSAKVTTPSLCATPPMEGNFKIHAYVIAVADKFPSNGGVPEGRGGYPCR